MVFLVWFKVNLVQLAEVLKSWRFQFDSPISSILLFPLSCQREPSGQKGLSSKSLRLKDPLYIKKTKLIS